MKKLVNCMNTKVQGVNLGLFVVFIKIMIGFYICNQNMNLLGAMYFK